MAGAWSAVGIASRGGRPGGGRRRVRRPPRRGSGASPAAPAGHIDCARPAPPSAGRRCRARAGSTTAARARGAGRSTPRPRSRGRRQSPGGSRIRSRISARRASAASRWRRSATLAGLSVFAQSAAGQVEHEQVDRAAGQERARDREALVEAGRGDDDEPLEPDAAGDRLDRVEAAREVQPGHDRARRLGLRDDPQRERRPAAGAVAADRDAGRLREAARPEDRIERGEAGVDDAVVVEAGLGLVVVRASAWSDATAGAGARARAPMTRGAAAPHRARRPATAASTSPRAVDIGRSD